MLPAVTCIIRVRLPPSARATRLPYTTLFRSSRVGEVADDAQRLTGVVGDEVAPFPPGHVEERLDLCPVVVGNRPGEDGGYVHLRGRGLNLDPARLAHQPIR